MPGKVRDNLLNPLNRHADRRAIYGHVMLAQREYVQVKL